MTKEKFAKELPILCEIRIENYYRIGHWRIEIKDNKYRCYNEMSSGKAGYSFNTIDELFAFEINGKTIGSSLLLIFSPKNSILSLCTRISKNKQNLF